MPPFLPGKELAKRFFEEAVGPIIAGAFPELPYSAGRIGPGSDVLGFDSEMSMDHDWGPRAQIFLRGEDLDEFAPALGSVLRSAMPREFLGFSTHYRRHEDGSTLRTDSDEGEPLAEITTWTRFLVKTLGFAPSGKPTAREWLIVPAQTWLSLQSGEFFRDDLGLASAREPFGYYPRDVWLYLLASQWSRIAEEEHLVGRAGFAGDDLGARLIASRLVRDLMSIAFLMERRFAPYPKWFGSAFRHLELAPELSPLLHQVLEAESWRPRDAALASAYECIARAHNRLGITEPIPERCGKFHGRPFHVIELTGKVVEKLMARIEDPELLEIAKRRPIGGIDTFSDSTDLRCDFLRQDALKELY